MSARARSRVAVHLTVAALVGWFAVGQVTDWPLEVTVAGMAAIAAGVAALGRWVG